MINYVYWLAIFAVLFCVAFFTVKTRFWKTGATIGATILFGAWALFYFKYEQYFVKNLGGTMSISVPNGQIHIGITWKDDNLWVENFDPKTNTCYFGEYSKGNMLQGKVVIKHCNPALPSTNPEPADPITEVAEPAVK